MIFSTLRVFFQNGWQSMSRLERRELPETYRGIAELSTSGLEPETLAKTAAMCPTGAISVEPFSLDMGRCLFCGECQAMMPGNIRFSRNWRLWSGTRDGLIVRADTGVAEPAVGTTDPRFQEVFRKSLKLRQVCAGGDGANELELNAAGNVNFDMRHYGIEFTASPMHADGIVLTGPITRKMAPYVQRVWDSVPEPKVLVLMGTDAISGGMFEGTEEIDREFLEGVEPSLYIAGHPVHPLSFIGGVRELMGQHLPPQRRAWRAFCRGLSGLLRWIWRGIVQGISKITKRIKNAGGNKQD